LVRVRVRIRPDGVRCHRGGDLFGKTKVAGVFGAEKADVPAGGKKGVRERRALFFFPHYFARGEGEKRGHRLRSGRTSPNRRLPCVLEGKKKKRKENINQPVPGGGESKNIISR